MASEIHKGDIGTKFIITLMDDEVIEDISSATTKQIIFQKHSNTDIIKDAIFETDGTDGKIYYISIDGDLDETGTWTIQAKITMPSGAWSSSTSTFTVHSNLI